MNLLPLPRDNRTDEEIHARVMEDVAVYTNVSMRTLEAIALRIGTTKERIIEVMKREVTK